MSNVMNYQRTLGRQLTYRIRADDLGTFIVLLGDKELLRGQDPLTAGGRRQAPNKRKVAGAFHQARLAIESLSQMNEI